MSETEDASPRKNPAWTPPVVEWALKTLPPSLSGEEQGRIEACRLDWEGYRLEVLEEGGAEERVSALTVLLRHVWHPELRERAGLLRSRLFEEISVGEAMELSKVVLEFGHLGLVEQEELAGGERAEVLAREREQVLQARSCLKTALAEAGEDRAREGRRLQDRLKSLARKLRNHEDEARLNARLEGIFGRWTVSVFTRFTFLCLIALLFLLLLDAFVPEDSEGFKRGLINADTAICCVFMLEFLVRITLVSRRHAWFLRHFLTDFVPALPFGLLFHGNVGAVPTLARFFRVPLYARYLRFLRPLVALFRMLIFWIRGMDRLVEAMAPLLNRRVILFEREEEGEDRDREPPRKEREHRITHGFERLSPEMRKEVAPRLLSLLEKQIALHRAKGPSPQAGPLDEGMDGRRVTRAEELLEFLEDLRAEDVQAHLSPEVVQSLGRLLHLMDLPLLRSLPFLGKMVRAGKGATPSDRIAHAGRKLGGFCGKALGFIAGWADLSGVLTAPQILDRIATALQKSTQRPAVRLLLFGLLFLLIKFFIEMLPFGLHMPEFLNRLVGIPLLALGTICLVLLILAKWLKRIAGEASERLLRSAEARFVNLLELGKRRFENETRQAVVERVLGRNGTASDDLGREVQAAMDRLRGRGGGGAPASSRARNLGLLLLDAQDGAFLHKTDTKCCEQFLSHPDLWNLRNEHLGIDRGEKKTLSRLDLETGGLFSGPFLWFDLITHAVSLKVARLCSSYNLHLIPKKNWDRSTEEEKQRHRDLFSGKDELKVQPEPGLPFQGSSFHVLHFLSRDPIWAKEVEDVFGPEILAKIVSDRQELVREIFGTRALHRMPIEERSFNPYDYYQGKLGGGRLALLPLKLMALWIRMTWILGKLAFRSAKDILDPRTGKDDYVDRRAPFAVARRKLRRMKKPLLVEVIRLSARVDPEYLGLGSAGEETDHPSHWRSDLALADPTPREVEEIEGIREGISRRLLYLPRLLPLLPKAEDPGTVEHARLVSAFGMDEGGIARLTAAEERARAWLHASREEEAPPGSLPTRGMGAPSSRGSKGFRLLLGNLGTVSRRERRWLKRAFRKDLGDFRLVCLAFAEAHPGLPIELARRRAGEFLAGSGVFQGRLETLRAIHALIVLDLRHHEDLIFELGGYECLDSVPGPGPDDS